MSETKRLTSQIALGMVLRIEELQDQINAIYREAQAFDGVNNYRAIEEIIKARKDAAEANYQATATLDALDFDHETDERVAEAPEAAWPTIAKALREQVVAEPTKGQAKILKEIDQIDRLHAMAVAKHLPVITRAELDDALDRAAKGG